MSDPRRFWKESIGVVRPKKGAPTGSTTSSSATSARPAASAVAERVEAATPTQSKTPRLSLDNLDAVKEIVTTLPVDSLDFNAKVEERLWLGSEPAELQAIARVAADLFDVPPGDGRDAVLRAIAIRHRFECITHTVNVSLEPSRLTARASQLERLARLSASTADNLAAESSQAGAHVIAAAKLLLPTARKLEAHASLALQISVLAEVLRKTKTFDPSDHWIPIPEASDLLQKLKSKRIPPDEIHFLEIYAGCLLTQKHQQTSERPVLERDGRMLAMLIESVERRVNRLISHHSRGDASLNARLASWRRLLLNTQAEVTHFLQTGQRPVAAAPAAQENGPGHSVDAGVASASAASEKAGPRSHSSAAPAQPLRSVAQPPAQAPSPPPAPTPTPPVAGPAGPPVPIHVEEPILETGPFGTGPVDMPTGVQSMEFEDSLIDNDVLGLHTASGLLETSDERTHDAATGSPATSSAASPDSAAPEPTGGGATAAVTGPATGAARGPASAPKLGEETSAVLSDAVAASDAAMNSGSAVSSTVAYDEQIAREDLELAELADALYSNYDEPPPNAEEPQWNPDDAVIVDHLRRVRDHATGQVDPALGGALSNPAIVAPRRAALSGARWAIVLMSVICAGLVAAQWILPPALSHPPELNTTPFYGAGPVTNVQRVGDLLVTTVDPVWTRLAPHDQRLTASRVAAMADREGIGSGVVMLPDGRIVANWSPGGQPILRNPLH